jgi:glycosyltransferase involved in cell wall biosynthesis
VTDDCTSRPFSFLVSTPGGRDARAVLDAIGPVLARLGSWRQIHHPESSLTHVAAEIEAEGGRAVQFAIGEAQDCYLTPAVPTVFVPLWDYAEVPSVDLNHNGRTNWARIADRVDLILAPSLFTLNAFRDSGVSAPAAILPIPAREGWADVPTWGPGISVSVDVPHVIWGGEPVPDRVARAASPADEETGVAAAAGRWSARLVRAGRRRLRRLKPYLSNDSIERIDGYCRRFGPSLLRPNPVKILGGVARLGYRHLVRRWIGERAHSRLAGMRQRLRRLPTPPPAAVYSCVAPSMLTLEGLVYSTVIDYSDPTIDDLDLLSAALHAFRDRDDVTLLIRLVTTADREAHDLGRLAHAYQLPRMKSACRVVVVIGQLDPLASMILTHGTSYHVETSRSRGLSLPLIEALAAGRPAITPAHSSYLDWIDEDVGLVVSSNPEPTRWPIDPVGRHATYWHRAIWTDLRDRLIESAGIADDDPERYEFLSANARARIADRADIGVVTDLLRDALEQLPERRPGALAWN